MLTLFDVSHVPKCTRPGVWEVGPGNEASSLRVRDVEPGSGSGIGIIISEKQQISHGRIRRSTRSHTEEHERIRRIRRERS